MLGIASVALSQIIRYQSEIHWDTSRSLRADRDSQTARHALAAGHRSSTSTSRTARPTP